MAGMDFRDIVVEFATVGDAQVLSTMTRDWVEAGLGWSYRADRITRLIASPNHTAVVARDGSRIVGFAIMEFGDERAHLVLLAVRPSHRRRGIARRMAQWLIDRRSPPARRRCTSRCASPIRRRTRSTASSASRRSLRIEGYYQGRETAVRMIRMLRAPTLPLPRMDAAAAAAALNAR